MHGDTKLSNMRALVGRLDPRTFPKSIHLFVCCLLAAATSCMESDHDSRPPACRALRRLASRPARHRLRRALPAPPQPATSRFERRLPLPCYPSHGAPGRPKHARSCARCLQLDGCQLRLSGRLALSGESCTWSRGASWSSRQGSTDCWPCLEAGPGRWLGRQ